MFRKLMFPAVAAFGLTIAAGHAQAFSIWPFSDTSRHAHYHVQFRLLGWRAQAFHNYLEARHFEDQKRDQGFEVVMHHHSGHWVIHYRLPEWRTFRVVASHALAHDLEHHLEAGGYEVRVVHH